MEKKNEKIIDLGYEAVDIYRNAICLRKKLEDDVVVYCDINFEDKTIEFSESSSNGNNPAEPYAAMIEEVEAAMDILYAESFTANFGGYNA